MSASSPDVSRDKVLEKYCSIEPKLVELKQNIQEEFSDLLSDLDNIDYVSFRVKRPESFIEKAFDRAGPDYEFPLEQIEDQVAGRIITYFRDDLEAVKKILQENFRFVESTRRGPDDVQQFGYEGHHLNFNIPPHLEPHSWGDIEEKPQTFEIQIRTLMMHAWIEPQHQYHYKGGAELDEDGKRKLFWIASQNWGADQIYNELWRNYFKR